MVNIRQIITICFSYTIRTSCTNTTAIITTNSSRIIRAIRSCTIGQVSLKCSAIFLTSQNAHRFTIVVSTCSIIETTSTHWHIALSTLQCWTAMPPAIFWVSSAIIKVRYELIACLCIKFIPKRIVTQYHIISIGTATLPLKITTNITDYRTTVAAVYLSIISTCDCITTTSTTPIAISIALVLTTTETTVAAIAITLTPTIADVMSIFARRPITPLAVPIRVAYCLPITIRI